MLCSRYDISLDTAASIWLRTETMVTIIKETCVTRQGGMLYRCEHEAKSTACKMTFAIFLPKSYTHDSKMPSLYYLSGLTCTDKNVSEKAGSAAFKQAEQHSMAMVMPDTSPRGDSVANDDKYDLGQGAGFYINATQDPWKPHFQMESYVQKELPELVCKHWPGLCPMRRSVTGHSMGGHGALTLAFKSRLNGDACPWVSVSAFAPICHPTNCPWGKKAFSAYLGDESAGKDHDATELLAKAVSTEPKMDDILIDQGLDDEFLAEQLCLGDFEAEAEKVGQKVTVRRHEKMDHSYYFIAACIADHVDFHAKRLKSV